MTRWRYNVYRVPPKTDGEAGSPDSVGSSAARTSKDNEDRSRTGRALTLRQADSVYEDVM